MGMMIAIFGSNTIINLVGSGILFVLFGVDSARRAGNTYHTEGDPLVGLLGATVYGMFAIGIFVFGILLIITGFAK